MMRKAFLLGIICCWPVAAAAQIVPQPSAESHRVHMVRTVPGEPMLLTLLPQTPLTVLLKPGESIMDVTPGPGDEFRIRVAADRNSFVIFPAKNARSGTLDIAIPGKRYSFTLHVEPSYAAALLVRLVDQEPTAPPYPQPLDSEAQPLATWRYRLRGDREVQPADLFDDGFKTRITYAPGQALPAVFAIGPTGEEEVVNGYMRDGAFVIDRVYEELVFRIDREKATARRNKTPEEAQ